jgi:hypothetical protein
MKNPTFLVTLLAGLLTSTAALAADTIVYVHGWLPDGYDMSWSNNTSSSAYQWGQTLPDPVHVGWNTSQDWRSAGVPQAVAVLDSRCSRAAGKSCTVICHSAGCAITSAALDIHGWNGAEPRWRINRVLALASAEGGSELGSVNATRDMIAAVFGYSGYHPSRQYLTPQVVRASYDHNDTATTPVLHVAGYDGDITSTIIPGQDDGAVGFHSACGYVKVFGSTWCSNDWEWVYKGWGIYVQRTVGRWQNHNRVEHCGRDGCDKTHMQLVAQQFQDLALLPNP